METIQLKQNGTVQKKMNLNVCALIASSNHHVAWDGLSVRTQQAKGFEGPIKGEGKATVWLLKGHALLKKGLLALSLAQVKIWEAIS